MKRRFAEEEEKMRREIEEIEKEFDKPIYNDPMVIPEDI